MKEFIFYAPTEVVFGKGAQQKTADLIKKHGGTRVLVVYGGSSAVKSGLLKQITDQLSQNDIIYKTFGGVKPNPVSSHTRMGIETAIGFNADFILAVGGGSVIDEAKAIAHGVSNPETDFLDYWYGKAVLTRSLPVGTILTISAAGSETSASSVITNDENGEKRGFTSEFNRPRFAVMNPELTSTLPKYQIACGIVDIMMHTLERYFTNTDGNQITDEIAEAVLRVVIENGAIAVNDPENYNAMSEIMWCGSLSHNGLTGLGRPLDFSAHQMGHELSGRFDVSHGASLSTMWGSWAEYCYKTDLKRFARYASKVWGIEDSDVHQAARLGINKTVEYFKLIGMPTCMTELGVGLLSDKVVDELADSCVFYGKRTVGNFRPLKKDDIVKIYNLANH